MTPPRDIGLRVAGALVLCVVVGLLGCEENTPDVDPDYRDLEPYQNRFRELTDLYEEQPHRDNPRAVEISDDGETLWIALQGSVDNPGREVVELETATMDVVKRHTVGSSPSAIAIHPGGRFVVVANRFSNYLSVIDRDTREVTRQPADFYVVGLAFSKDGRRLYLTNRWRDSLQVRDVEAAGGKLRLSNVDRGAAQEVPVGVNPRDVRLGPTDDRAYVAAIGGLTISVVVTDRLREVDTDDDASTADFGAADGVSRLRVGAPPNDLVIHDGYLFVATLSASTHHPPDRGPDTNRDGIPGDGTPNIGFQDLQNEIAVYRLDDLEEVHRYTSDTICCFDYRDVSPDDPEWGDWLPDPATWIVGGSLPERLDVTRVDGKDVLVVVYSGSSEIQRFEILEDGALRGGKTARTGINPSGLAVDHDSGTAYVTNRLEETVSVIDLSSMEVVEDVVVGDVSGGEFPATDAEIGEFYYFAGADFSFDGDQTCNHCHRDRGNVGKAFSMPLLADSRGSRMTPASRGLLETRPWFFEGAMDENNFFPVINEFARAENFCCHDRDPSCAVDPPDECRELDPPHSFPTRDSFFLQTARDLLGRDRSFGGAIPTRIDYLGVTRLLGLFLLHEPAMLPNPNRSDTADVERGRQIFRSGATGCLVCHPKPGFAVSFDYNPFDTLLHFGPVVTPTRSADGKNLDLANPGFLGTFPMARQDDNDVRLNAPMLAGLWDRAPGFLHDGRARNLREALCTPNHPALGDEETGYNESDGIPDTHGGTSELTADDVRDLKAYLLSL